MLEIFVDWRNSREKKNGSIEIFVTIELKKATNENIIL